MPGALRTFRDPAGSVEVRPDRVLRLVHPAHAPACMSFLESPIASRLAAQGMLIPAEVVCFDAQGMLLEHPRIPFISYPWEWPPTLWLAAARHTLALCERLIPHGWLLKDATPLNILFRGTTPIFIDLLSVEPTDPASGLWLPYAQFVRTFLLPLLAYTHLGWPLQAAQTTCDGIEPEALYRHLPWSRLLSRPAFSAVTLPTLLSRSTSFDSFANSKRSAADPEIAHSLLLRTLRKLRGAVEAAAPPPRPSAWSRYTDTARHYEAADHATKRLFVSEVLAARRPATVLDVGCNTGVYSQLAADAGASVVAIDTDVEALQRVAEQAQRSGKDILPLCVDLARPTPATGWENRENQSFLERAAGHFDCVLMLAVLHHLLLSSQIPMPHIARLAAELTRHTLVVEWVPPTDPRFVDLLRGRATHYTHLSLSSFREAFSEHFRAARELPLGNGRILFHFEKV